MVPYVSSSDQHSTIEDTLESISNPALDEQHDNNSSFNKNKDGLTQMMTLEDNKANGAVSFISLLDPGGENNDREGKQIIPQAYLQIRGVSGNWFSHFSMKTCCGYSL